VIAIDPNCCALAAGLADCPPKEAEDQHRMPATTAFLTNL
jgi:hypothetical protein